MMSVWELTNITARLLLPPGVLFVVALLGLAVMRSRVRFGAGLVTVSVLSLYVLSTPVVAYALLRSLQPPYEDPAGSSGADAIVILTGGNFARAREYDKDVPSAPSLERARYGAYLQRRTGKPILVTGGNPSRQVTPEAETMSVFLRELGANVKWIEVASDNTFQSAHNSAEILKKGGIHHVYLVTHGWHMPRARMAFERAGLSVVAAPMAYASPRKRLRALDFVPNGAAFQASYNFFHEVAGSMVYRLRFDLGR